MKKTLVSLLLGVSSVAASALPLTFTNEGVINQTTVFRAALGGLGLTHIGSVTITDSNSGVGGSAGVFSGFDLDFVFLDLDGVFATDADRVFGSFYNFTTGTVRATADPNLLPTAGRPGPTAGSLAVNTIDAGLATLDTLDGFFPALFTTDNVSGWLTLGDGGALSLSLSGAPIVLTGSEALFLGEVGTDAGELVDGATVSVSQNPIPEPATLALLGLALAGFGLAQRKARSV